jgi:hypothetical protein
MEVGLWQSFQVGQLESSFLHAHSRSLALDFPDLTANAVPGLLPLPAVGGANQRLPSLLLPELIERCVFEGYEVEAGVAVDVPGDPDWLFLVVVYHFPLHHPLLPVLLPRTVCRISIVVDPLGMLNQG